MSDELVTAAERIARLILCHRVQLPGAGARGHGGLTAADAAAVLAGLAREPLLLVRIAWCGEWGLLEELERATWHYLVDRVVAPQGWHRQVGPRGHWYWRRMALLALCETLLPPSYGSNAAPCPACLGWAPARMGLNAVQCPLCRGARRVRYGSRVRARLVGMPYKTWDYWSPRYLQFVRPIPLGWEAEAQRHVRARLRHGEPGECAAQSAHELSGKPHGA